MTQTEILIKNLAEGELVRAMKEAGMDKTTLSGLGTLFIQDMVYTAIVPGKTAAVYDWLRANGHGDLIRDYVQPSTLKVFVKDLRSKNEPLPEEVKVTVIPTVQTRAVYQTTIGNDNAKATADNED